LLKVVHTVNEKQFLNLILIIHPHKEQKGVRVND